MDNTGHTLVLDETTGSWLMNGTPPQWRVECGGRGTIGFGSGTLDGVTVNGDIDVGRLINRGGHGGAQQVDLEWHALRGQSHQQLVWAGGLCRHADIRWRQGPWCSAIKARAMCCARIPGHNLTLGTNITVRGHSGQIGQSTSCIGTPANVSVINQGVISADISGGTINLRAQNFTNQALVRALSSSAVLIDTLQNTATGSVLATNGTLTLNGNWNNAGIITATNSTVNPGGGSSLVGNFQRGARC